MKNCGTSILATPKTTQVPCNQLSERELVALTASGNGEAFAVIFRRYEQRLIRTALRIAGNVSDAEDIVQEALMKAHKNIAAFRFESSLSTWLTQIVINCALMELRRRKTRTRFSLNDANENGVSLLELICDPNADVEEEVFLREQSQLLTTCIARLPPNLRTVIEDYRISAPSMAELAQSHSITVAAAKSRLLRAKTSIKKSGRIVNAMRQTVSKCRMPMHASEEKTLD
jgi:RNA polymerase sigma factor (sigma-70 family)